MHEGEARLRVLETRLEEATARNQQLAKAVEGAEARCDVLAKKLQASEDSERTLNGSILAMQTQIQLLEGRVARVDDENNALQEALDNKRDELLVSEGKLENTQAAYDELAKSVRLSEAQKDKYDRQIGEARAELEEAQAQVDSLQVLVKDLEAQVFDRTAVQNQLSADLSSAETRAQMLEDQMLVSQQTERELNRIVEERSAENQKLDQQLKSVEAELINVRRRHKLEAVDLQNQIRQEQQNVANVSEFSAPRVKLATAPPCLPARLPASPFVCSFVFATAAHPGCVHVVVLRSLNPRSKPKSPKTKAWPSSWTSSAKNSRTNACGWRSKSATLSNRR